MQLQNMRQRLQTANSKYIEYVIDNILHELMLFSKEINALLASSRLQDELPDLMIILSSSTKDIAICRINAKFFLFPPRDKPEYNENVQCWLVRNFVLKVCFIFFQEENSKY